MTVWVQVHINGSLFFGIHITHSSSTKITTCVLISTLVDLHPHGSDEGSKALLLSNERVVERGINRGGRERGVERVVERGVERYRGRR